MRISFLSDIVRGVVVRYLVLGYNLGSVLDTLCEWTSREEKYLFIIDIISTFLFPSLSVAKVESILGDLMTV